MRSSNPSPTAKSSVSKSANDAADKSMYHDVTYTNAAKMGPPLIVLPGEVKSNNAGFAQKFGPNNIADFAELELSKANFQVLESCRPRADAERDTARLSVPATRMKRGR